MSFREVTAALETRRFSGEQESGDNLWQWDGHGRAGVRNSCSRWKGNSYMTRAGLYRKRSIKGGEYFTYKVQSYHHDSERSHTENDYSHYRYDYNWYSCEFPPEPSLNYQGEGVSGSNVGLSTGNAGCEGYSVIPESLALQSEIVANSWLCPLQQAIPLADRVNDGRVHGYGSGTYAWPPLYRSVVVGWGRAALPVQVVAQPAGYGR